MIEKGDSVKLKPEWQDAGDDQFRWIAVENEDGGRVAISPADTGLAFAPVCIVCTDWILTTDGR